MLALSAFQVQKRAKPALWWLIASGLCLLGLLFAWGGAPWPGLISFGGGVIFAYLGLKPAKLYKPGVSFKTQRRQDATIIRNYRLTVATGAIIISVLILWKLTVGLETGVLVRAGLLGVGLAAYGYRGLIAKRVHGDVDAVAVDLAHEHGSSRRNKIYLAYVNFVASDQLNKAGNRILLVGADKLMMCVYTDGSWKSSEQPFFKIASLGFLRHNNETLVYFEFIDGTIFQTTIDPTNIVTTEPKTFLRSLLSLLDSWCEAPQATATPISVRRKIVAAGTKSQDMVEAIALVGQAQEAHFATAAINSALAALIPQPRKLEI